jgi:hypothetical protein
MVAEVDLGISDGRTGGCISINDLNKATIVIATYVTS